MWFKLDLPGLRSHPLVLGFPPFSARVRLMNFLTLAEGIVPAPGGCWSCDNVLIARELETPMKKV